MGDTVTDSRDLCQNCQKIMLDDSAIGGVTEQSGDGRHYLTFKHDNSRKELPVSSWHDSLPNLPNLLKSYTVTGCKMCRYLRQAIIESNVKYLYPDIYIRLTYVWHFDGSIHDRERLRGLAATIHGEVEVNHLFFKLESDDGEVGHWLGILGCPRPMPLCEENIAWIKSKLAKSQDEFKTACDPKFVPTRLIDLGDNFASDPRLISTAEPPESELRYAALSYCWGPEKDSLRQLKLQSSLLKTFTENIPLSSFTQAMKDAVAVCRSLGIRFLWVDALCIIQDSHEDWEEQSTKMSKIFRNAHITICGLSSNSTHESFLNRRQHILNINFTSLLEPSISGQLRLSFRGAFNHYATLDEVYTELESSLWSKRGWTFQEEQVSSRKIYFGRSISFLEFLDHHSREDGFNDKSYLASLYAMISDGYENPKDLPYTWQQELMINFAPRVFTFRDDKLPSISGLANEIFRVTGDSYHAGIWEKHIPCGLLWNVEVNKSRPGLPSLIQQLTSHPYVAPSWSFLSRSVYAREGVTFRGHPYQESHFRSELDTFEAWTTPVGHDPFGKIENGTLRVKGRLVPASEFLLVDQEDSSRTIIRAQTWTMNIGGSWNCFCQLDWFCQSGQVTSTDLSLLLLGSTCGDLETTPSSPIAVGYDPIHGSTENEGERLNQICSQCCSKSKNPDSAVHPSCPICAHCTKCCTAHRGISRKAWGIIIYHARDLGKYYRVGIFVSETGGKYNTGGTRLFDDTGPQTIDII